MTGGNGAWGTGTTGLFDVNPTGDVTLAGGNAEVAARRFSDPETLNKIGAEHYLRGNFAAAEECFLAVLQANAHHAAAWSNLGLARQKAGLLDAAFECYLNALRERESAGTLANLGWLYQVTGKYEHAIRCLQRAVDLDPLNAEAEVNLGYCYLYQFRFAEAWPLMAPRFRTNPPLSVARDYDMPHWDGEKCKRLYIWWEHGIGDQVLYLTLLPELIALGQEFICEVDARLIPALKRSFPAGEFISDATQASGACDRHIPMMDLAALFRKGVDSFASQPLSLLTADVGRWSFDSQKKKIAISWRSYLGKFNAAKERQKSAMLSDFDELGAREDVSLLNVQYGDNARELAAWTGSPIYTPGIDLFNDIEGVLGFIDSCDAIVTTSNVTAHFAGALGKPTFLILKGDVPPFFYWQPNALGRSLWYPSVRVIQAPTYAEAIAIVSRDHL